jgi:hypothetical protein
VLVNATLGVMQQTLDYYAHRLSHIRRYSVTRARGFLESPRTRTMMMPFIVLAETINSTA